MIKKRTIDGEPCRKCRQAQDVLERRGLWPRIDEVVWAAEGQPESEGMVLAREYRVEEAPFFIVTRDDGSRVVYRRVLELIREQLGGARPNTGREHGSPDTHELPDMPDMPDIDAIDDINIETLGHEFAAAEPADILRWGLESFGRACAIAFSGAEDVALIDMAARTGLPFSVFTLDTGRLHPETYEFIDRVRQHYGVEVAVMTPRAERLEPFVQQKGLFSFYRDGHKECCGVRKVEPLERALAGYRAWVTGQRRDQSPETRDQTPEIQVDGRFRGAGQRLIKLNPLARWSSQQTWDYIRDHKVPYNPLHERGFISIGCAPCTRAVLPGQHERDGRWWWEQADSKECGLHTG
jgi:phosphoadenosine phosphosulfate reductase